MILSTVFAELSSETDSRQDVLSRQMYGGVYDAGIQWASKVSVPHF